ncbi:MAG: STAS domain-containing protein [Pseudomonadota bacterium]
MELTSHQSGALHVVTVKSSRIDAAVAIEFKDAMRVQSDNDFAEIVLDLSLVEFIDSSGLGAIVASMKSIGPDRTLILAGLTPNVEKVFRLTRMDSVFSVFPSLERALEAHAA